MFCADYSKGQMMQEMFFHRQIVIYSELTPGKHINKTMYTEMLYHLQQTNPCKHPHLWECGNWWLHHGSVPVQQSV
jgi:hypothetical protein